jgi:hypothetical protein
MSFAMNMLFLIIILLIYNLFVDSIDRSVVVPHLRKRIVEAGVTIEDLARIAEIYVSNYTLEVPLQHSLRRFAIDYALDRPKPVHKLLCTTFGESTPDGLTLLSQRILSLESGCHWAIFIYRGSQALAEDFNRNLSTRSWNKSKVVLFHYNTSRLDIMLEYGIFGGLAENMYRPDVVKSVRQSFQKYPYNRKILPKPMLLMYLLPMIGQYERVWLFDGDISVQEFDLPQYLFNLHCAFSVPPYISQPLVKESTQSYRYLNSNGWLNRPDAIVAGTGFIEVQTPVFHAGLLEWILRNVVSRVIWPLHVLGADFGFDTLFCRSATLFAEEMALIEYLESLPNYNRNNLEPLYSSISEETMESIRKPLVPCAVVVRGTPISHQDSKVILKDVGLRIKESLNALMRQLLIELFPHIYYPGNILPSDPRSIRSRSPIANKLIDNCQYSYY